MKLQINCSEPKDFPILRLTLAGLVDQLGMKMDRVAIELNRSIVALAISGQKPAWLKAIVWRSFTLVGGGSEN